MIPILKTPRGELYQADCLKVLKSLKPETVDLAFADPPFNLGKKYSSKIDDAKASHEYLDWCKTWLNGMDRVLKPGGSHSLWNPPRTASAYGFPFCGDLRPLAEGFQPPAPHPLGPDNAKVAVNTGQL